MSGGGWLDPIVGGTALRIPAIRSPNYIAGSSGWTINQDGSVEFNNGTFRGTVTAGTFQGTDFVINSTGAFFYSGVPAAGNLIASIVPGGAGTDSFGNHYVQGYGSYDNTNSTFAQVIGADFKVGQVNAGVPDTTNAASLSSLFGIPGVALWASGFAPPNGPNAAEIELQAGQNSAVTGSGNCPTIVSTGSTAGSTASDVDWLHAGSIIRVEKTTGVQETWAQPGAAPNWTVGTLQYRRTVEDEVWWVGSVTYTGANVTNASAQTPTLAVGGSHSPKAQWKDDCSHLTSTSVQKNVAATVIFNTNGTLQIQWGDGMAGTTHDVNGLATGDIFWINSRVPLGNIP